MLPDGIDSTRSSGRLSFCAEPTGSTTRRVYAAQLVFVTRCAHSARAAGRACRLVHVEGGVPGAGVGQPTVDAKDGRAVSVLRANRDELACRRGGGAVLVAGTAAHFPTAIGPKEADIPAQHALAKLLTNHLPRGARCERHHEATEQHCTPQYSRVQCSGSGAANAIATELTSGIGPRRWPTTPPS
jgi:hypothetical protein